jgi:hypothetical protein
MMWIRAERAGGQAKASRRGGEDRGRKMERA